MPAGSSSEVPCVTALGMASALGDVQTACAAARAGLRRSKELDYFPVFSLADGSVTGAVGHPVSHLTGGFEGRVRRLRLAHAGLADLLRHVPNPGRLSSARSAFYVSLANSARTTDGAEPDDGARQREAQRLLGNAARIAGWPGEPKVAFVTTSGHTGAAEALAAAVTDLRSGRVGTAIVGGIDTLVEEDTLSWLHRTERLKTPNRAVGLEPGEAAAFVVVESEATAAPAGTVLACIADVKLGNEPRTLRSAGTSVGEGLANAVIAAAPSARPEEEPPPWLLSDHNGESYRAHEWGNAIVRLRARSAAFEALRLWYPAINFGDTGAASGVIAMCVAARAFERGYAPARRVTLTSTGDGPERAAVVMHAASLLREARAT